MGIREMVYEFLVKVDKFRAMKCMVAMNMIIFTMMDVMHICKECG